MSAFTLTAELAREVAHRFGTPTYVYDEATLRRAAAEVAAFPAPFGLTPRFAMKANPNRAVLRIFDDAGLSFDASTVYEAERLLRAGIAPERVQLTAQVLGASFESLIERGIEFTACSLLQIRRFAAAFPGRSCGLRLNPGEGSGHNNRTSVAGPAASFGLWFEQLDEALELASALDVTLDKAHHHVGSGGEPQKWASIAAKTLSLVERMPDVTTVNLGGGFPIARMPGQTQADLRASGEAAAALLRDFAERTGRRLHLEIEPGTYLSANAGVVVARVEDVVTTGAEGYRFVKLDAGMPEVLRPSIYGAQHPLRFIAATAERSLGAEGPVVLVGPCCESGDLLTPAAGDPERIEPRTLPNPCRGDLCEIGGSGAYCASMAAKHYNSIPAAPEVLLGTDGSLTCVRRRQTLDDLLRDEDAVLAD